MNITTESMDGKPVDSDLTSNHTTITVSSGLMFYPDDSYEIRGLYDHGKPRTRIVRADDPEGLTEAVNSMDGANGVYLTLNPVPDGHRGPARDEHIEMRRGLLIDVDAVRPKRANTTDEEKAYAIDLTEEIAAYL